MGIAFLKGHGTQNDFVVLPDPDAALDLTAERVVALCDRRRGLGADGVLRVVRWAKLAGTDASVPEPVPGVEWFMDYRNGDGSVAEMCGNGVRVFARYLHERGWLPGGGPVGTRAGVRTAEITAGGVSVDMGPVRIGPASVATAGGARFDGIALDVGNPHLACVLSADPDALDLTRAPGHDPQVFPHGVNVEFVTPLSGPADGGRIRMRVHERGVGETRACGTGTVAAAVAALRHAGHDAGDVHVDTPGGPLRVTVEAGTGAGTPASTGRTVLHGPAELLATGELARDWWDAQR